MLAGWLVGCGAPRRFHDITGKVWATKTGLGRALLKCVDHLIALCASQVFADSVSQCYFLVEGDVVWRGYDYARLGIGGRCGSEAFSP